MAIGHVVTRGYGNGTFVGEVRQVVARGFFNSAVAPVQTEQLPNISVRSDTGTSAYPLAGYFIGETGYTISPAVESGWDFDTTTGVLTIDSDDDGTFGPYTVTATNSAGSTPGNTFTVKVSPATGFGSGFTFTFTFRI